MPLSFSHRWTAWVIRYRVLVVVAWIALAIGVRLSAPAWNDVAYDGDFDYLPEQRTSVAGGRLLDLAFPQTRARSELVFLLSRDDGSISKRDEIVGLDVLRRLYHKLAEASWQRAIRDGYRGGPIDPQAEHGRWLELAKAALDESILTDMEFWSRIEDQVTDAPPTATEPRMAIAYWDRSRLLDRLHQPDQAVSDDAESAIILYPELAAEVIPVDQRDLGGWSSFIDVHSWNDTLIGSQLRSEKARLTIAQLSTELAATANIDSFEAAQSLIDESWRYSRQFVEPGVRLDLTGSAAIGGETLAASRDAIAYTEWFTVGMILIILTWVYRSPLLIAIPMLSIGIAVVVATGLVTHLTRWSMSDTWLGPDLRIFTTSRIFVVVILFGAGTDYCLFLIARLREEAANHPWMQACHLSLARVSGALLGSALTTIVGLAMLWFADFGKFHYTGPVIAICLTVGMLVCLTLTPALMCQIGPRVFWPSRPHFESESQQSLFGTSQRRRGPWGAIALTLTRFPRLSLIVGTALLLVPAIYGHRHEQRVTYDLSSQLGRSAVTPRGTDALKRHFEIGAVNPVTLLLLSPDDVPREEQKKRIKSLRDQLAEIDGVKAVRTADDPLGEREQGILSRDAILRRALRNHRLVQRHFFSASPRFAQRLVRLDLVLDGNPFEQETAQVLDGVAAFLDQRARDPQSVWHNHRVYLTGTTPSIMDLRAVTLRDNRVIKIAVIVSVLAVLYLVIRRVGLCIYLIATVLLSYYATLGLTVIFFKGLYGDDFLGLDWKLPVFLFVILVAVGQDYNVYLVTRILEEQRNLGWVTALRRALTRTGGIITACGMVMAATFFSMTASAWFPAVAGMLGIPVATPTMLQGIVQLGFALGLGVLIDTFYVRTILVPSFFAVLGKSA